VQALVLAAVIIAGFFLAMVVLLNAIGYMATVHDLNSPANSPVKAVVIFLLSGKWWMYLAALVLALIALVVMYELELRRAPTPAASVADPPLDPLSEPPPVQESEPGPLDAQSQSGIKADYHAVNQIYSQLQNLIVSLTAQQPKLSASEPLGKQMRVRSAFNEQVGIVFKDDYSRDLIKLTAHIRLQYGIIKPELADQHLNGWAMELGELESVASGLLGIVDDLGQMIVDEVFEQNER
jgi:hypothetical protein